MIECIFTVDYEIYGNGEGSLKELVYEPAEKLLTVFREWKARFVPFVEVAELEMIEAEGRDSTIDLVKHQIQEFYRDGFEIGLHLHPQWYKAQYENGRWLLDYSEYNLCTLREQRIAQILDRSIAYLRGLIGVPDFTPLSFRAGNWLFHPAETLAEVLASKGIKIDSSVFKGGVRHSHNLDYRPALKNGCFWRFQRNASMPDSGGSLIEVPIYAKMVPFWKMLSSKRVALERDNLVAAPSSCHRLNRLFDYLRLSHPLKLDFCRMSGDELIAMVDEVVEEDKKSPASYRPLVAIGHTKELVDFDAINFFLSYLKQKEIEVSTFEEVYPKCICD